MENFELEIRDGLRRRSAMEDEFAQQDIFDTYPFLQTGRSELDKTHGGNRRISSRTRGEQTGRIRLPSTKGLLSQEIKKKYLTIFPVPIESLWTTDIWSENPATEFLDIQSSEFAVAIRSIKTWTTRTSMHELYELYMNAPSIYWFSRVDPKTDPNPIYLSRDHSKAALLEFLEWQYGDKDAIIKFLYKVHAICEKKIPKRNALAVIGPPQCGKSWFFDCLTSYFLNVGYITSVNRNNIFGLQEAYNRRIIHMNEFNCEVSIISWD